MKPPLTLTAISEKKIYAQTNSLILSLEDDEAAVGYALHTSTNPLFFFYPTPLILRHNLGAS